MTLRLYAVHVVTYWVSCLLYMTIDLYRDQLTKIGIGRIVEEARLQQPPSSKKINSAIWVSVANQIIAMPIAMVIVPLCIDNSEWEYIVLKLIFYTLIADQWFYWAHRIMHHPRLYQHIHYIHHQWTYPMAVRTIYAHPLEHVIGNLGSFLIGPLIWNCNSTLLAAWVAIATFNAVSGHSGLSLTYWDVNVKHDLHHRYLNYNYGIMGISDRLYGTRKQS